MYNCPKCGGRPVLKTRKNKFYYECSGDCWTQTDKHSSEEDARREWDAMCAEEANKND